MTVEAERNMSERAVNKFQLDTDKPTGMRMRNIVKQRKTRNKQNARLKFSGKKKILSVILMTQKIPTLHHQSGKVQDANRSIDLIPMPYICIPSPKCARHTLRKKFAQPRAIP